MVVLKKNSLTWKIGHESPTSAKTTPTPTTLGNLRRFDVCELHPSSPVVTAGSSRVYTNNGMCHQQSISHLPGLNPDSAVIEKLQMKTFREMRRTTDQKLLQCRQGGRIAELLRHQEFSQKKERPKQLCIEWHKSSTNDAEIPIIDQIRMKRDKHNKLRPDILPVESESKAKLYFAFNRSKGTITRVIATQPKSFRFGLK